MDAHNFANTINNLFRSLVPVTSNDDDSDMPPLEPIPSPAGSSSSTAQNNDHSDLNNNNHHDDDEDMPELQSVSNSSNEDDSEDANEVEMQAVADDNDSAWTDESASNVPPLEPIYPVPPTNNPNRRARVDEDEDEERDRRHPSQRVGNPINLTTTTTTTTTLSDPTSPVLPTLTPPTEQSQQQPAPPTFPGPHVRATINIPGLVRTPADASRQQQPPPPQGAPAPANAPGAGANTPAQQPLFGGFAITIDLNGTPTLHPLLPGAPPHAHAHAHAHAHPEAGPHGHQPIPGGFAAFREFLGLFGVGAEREVEDPERAQRLVDALEEVPIGLVRRLESLGKDGEGQGAGAAGGDVGCAICWDRLLDGDGEGFGPVEKEMATTTEAEAEEAAIVGDEAMTMADSTSTLEKEAPAPASAEPPTRQYPKIVSLPCAHIFHAACLIPWFSRPRQTTCPTCRFNVDPEGLTARRRTLGDGIFGENAPQQPAQAAAGPGPAQVVGHVLGEGGEAVTDEQEAVGGVVMWDDTEVERVRAQIEQRTREVRERRQRERELATAGGGEEDRPEVEGDVPTAPASRDGEREGAGGDETPQQQPVAPAPMPDANQQSPQQAPGQGQGQRPQTGFLTIGFDVFIRGGPIAFGPQESTFAPAAGPAQGNANQGVNGNARPDANNSPNPTANANPGPNPNPNPNSAAPPRPLQTPGFPGVIMPMPMMQGMGMMEMDAMMSEMDMDEEEAMMADMGMDGMGGMGGVGIGGGGGGGAGGPEDEAEAQVAWAEFLQGVGMGQQGEGNAQGPQQQQQQQHGQGQGQGQGQQPLPPWMRGNAGGGQFVGGMGRTMEGVLGSLFTGAAGQGQAQPQAQAQAQAPGQGPGQGQEQNGAANGNAGQGQGQDQGPGQLGEFLARFFGHLGAQAQAQAPDARQGQGQQDQAGGVPLNPPNANAGPQFGMPPFASMFPGLHMNPPMNPPPASTAAAPGLGALQAAQPPVPPLAFVAGFPTTVRFQPQPQPQPHAHPHLHPHAQAPPPPPLRGPAPFFTAPGLRVPREKKAWSLPPAPGPTLRQRIERREREAGLRCCDVSCGVGPSDEEPVAVLTEAAKRQLSIHAPHRHMWEGEKEERGGEDERERSLCPHTFHPACLVSAARVALMGAEVKEVDGDVEVACSVCRGVGNVARGDWDEGVKALE